MFNIPKTHQPEPNIMRVLYKMNLYFLVGRVGFPHFLFRNIDKKIK